MVVSSQSTYIYFSISIIVAIPYISKHPFGKVNSLQVMRNACVHISKAKAQTFLHNSFELLYCILKSLWNTRRWICLFGRVEVSVFFLSLLRSRIKAIRANFLLAAISILVCLLHHRRRWQWRQHRQLSPVTRVNCIKWWMHFFFRTSSGLFTMLNCRSVSLSVEEKERVAAEYEK